MTAAGQKTPRHFDDIASLDAQALRNILTDARQRKQARGANGQAAEDADRLLQGKLLASIFEKPSTRTRISFDVAMRQLGGQTIVLSGDDMQLGRGETIADTARVLSRYVDAIMIRTNGHEVLEELMAHATVPVINGLTDFSHPCQLMADVMTFEEKCGAVAGHTLTWVGDGNNMAHSWIQGAVKFGYRLRLACPEPLEPSEEVVSSARAAGAEVEVLRDPYAAVDGSDCIATDTWYSMHDDPKSDRHNALVPYRVTEELMQAAKPDALFMHCLPAHRGDEVVAEVIDGAQSVVWDQAENRLHAQKGILAWCLG